MKKKIFALAVAAMAVLGAQAQNMVNGHEYVDLGLPSGTLWATMNVGASNEYERGEYTNFENVSDLLSWGEKWVIPTEAQWTELADNCDVTSDINYLNKTITYYKFTSKINDNYIIFPAHYDSNTGFYIYPFMLSSGKVAMHVQTNSTTKTFIGSIGSANVRLVANVNRYSISNVPDGWAVKTASSSKDVTVTSGVVNNIPVESSVVFTPANIPMGKKVKSVKVVPVE